MATMEKLNGVFDWAFGAKGGNPGGNPGPAPIQGTNPSGKVSVTFGSAWVRRQQAANAEARLGRRFDQL